jgi:hypothetical protein
MPRQDRIWVLKLEPLFLSGSRKPEHPQIQLVIKRQSPGKQFMSGKSRRPIKIMKMPDGNTCWCSHCQRTYDLKDSNAWDKRYYCSKSCQREQLCCSDLHRSVEQ